MAKDDFSALEQMLYSGRGIIVGMTPQEEAFIGYSLTGRSPPSQARKLVEGKDTHTIITDVTNPAELEKGSPALLLYPALAHAPMGDDIALMASNGAQTKLIYSAARRRAGRGETAETGLSAMGILLEAFKEKQWEYDRKDDRWIDITAFEPDDPNYTPRISACVLGNTGAMHIVSCDKMAAVPNFYDFVLQAGKGKLLTTYRGGNEKPLAPFEGEPKDVVICSSMPVEIAEEIYKVSKGADPAENYRVAAAVIMLTVNNEIETAKINRCERGE